MRNNRNKATVRKQVPKACLNCRKMHTGCDTQRPCKRCTQYGMQDSCIDLDRRRRSGKASGKRQREESTSDAEDDVDEVITPSRSSRSKRMCYTELQRSDEVLAHQSHHDNSTTEAVDVDCSHDHTVEYNFNTGSDVSNLQSTSVLPPSPSDIIAAKRDLESLLPQYQTLTAKPDYEELDLAYYESSLSLDDTKNVWEIFAPIGQSSWENTSSSSKSSLIADQKDASKYLTKDIMKSNSKELSFDSCTFDFNNLNCENSLMAFNMTQQGKSPFLGHISQAPISKNTSSITTSVPTVSNMELNSLIQEISQLKEANKSLESQLANRSTQSNPLPMAALNTNASMWNSFGYPSVAFSVWRTTANGTMLCECNERFVDLVGYPFSILKNNFSSSHLFYDIGGLQSIIPNDWANKSKIMTPTGLKDVHVCVHNAQGSNDVLIVQMMDA